jgi:hypothetical protein
MMTPEELRLPDAQAATPSNAFSLMGWLRQRIRHLIACRQRKAQIKIG